MNERILFQKNASVLTATGKKIGALERVVVNPATKVVSDIVVRTNGRLFTKADKVVPIHLVNQTTESEIVLEDQAGELQYFPYFEEEHTIDVSANINQNRNKEDNSPIIYGYPQFGPLVTASPNDNDRFISEIDQNIPEGTIAMKEGAKVITVEGKQVGTVDRISVDSSIDQVTDLMISTGLFAKDKKLIPIRWVATMGEDVIHLKVDKKSVEALDTASIG